MAGLSNIKAGEFKSLGLTLKGEVTTNVYTVPFSGQRFTLTGATETMIKEMANFDGTFRLVRPFANGGPEDFELVVLHGTSQEMIYNKLQEIAKQTLEARSKNRAF